MEQPVRPVAHDRTVSVGHELVLTERVITMRTIDGRLAGVQRLLVPPKSVVTPAVRDELRKHKIELSRSAIEVKLNSGIG